MLVLLVYKAGPAVMSCVSSMFQECCIKHQLDCGVRYCDLRIAHRPNDSSTHLYFYHGVYTTLTVEVTHSPVTHMQTDAKSMTGLDLEFCGFHGYPVWLLAFFFTAYRESYVSIESNRISTKNPETQFEISI